MSSSQEESREALLARMEDLSRKAEHGALAVSPFLSPREQGVCTQFLKQQGIPYATYGGYANAERKRIYCLPDYMESAQIPDELVAYGETSRIEAVEICGSGYRTLSHRDYLGALLGLGLSRNVVGDLYLPEDTGFRALVWLDTSIKEFVRLELKQVGSDTVKVKDLTLPPDFTVFRRVAVIRDTVASARLDAVVGALCSLSREQAKVFVAKGAVEVNYETEERGDRFVTEDAVISVRGYGKYRVRSVSELTKKGRLRLEAERYL